MLVLAIYSIDNDLPKVAKICKIFFVVNGSSLLFTVKCYSTSYFAYYRAYSLHDMDEEKLVIFEELKLYHPLHIRKIRTLTAHVIITPYSIVNGSLYKIQDRFFLQMVSDDV